MLRRLFASSPLPTRRRDSSKRRASFSLGYESIEARRVLSGCPVGYATPSFVRSHAADSVAAMATSGPTGYSPSQIRHAYGFDTVAFGSTAADGTGTTIAIVDAYDNPNIANDLKQFDLQFGLPDPVFKKVNQSGGSTMPAADVGWGSEIALDVEWAHAVAPGASILLVEAKSNSMSDLMAAVNYARNQPGVVAISMSWGGGEFSGETNYDSYFTTPSGHAGVSFFASSGDAGAPVSYPAASPNVVSVGGTSLFLSSGNYASESGWSGSGGGVSAYEPQPAYQSGTVTQSTTRRGNPDVAYDSDPSTGFAVYDSYANGSLRPWSQFGGTSAAAPQWAALSSIVSQGRALAGLGSLDGRSQLLPALYQLSSADFHDVTSGTSSGTPNYSAAAGYDLVTGRGSPVANLVIADLVALGGGGSTTVSPPSAPSIAAPANVTVNVLTKTSVQVAWTASAGASGYRVLISNGSTTSQIASVGAGTTAIRVSNLSRGVTYSFAVTAYNATSSATSPWVSVTMPAVVAVTSPRNVAFQGTSGSTGTLTWTASANATGYMVYAIDVVSRVRVSAYIDASATSITVSGLRPGRVYQFAVVAMNDDSSASSDWITITFSSASGPKSGRSSGPRR